MARPGSPVPIGEIQTAIPVEEGLRRVIPERNPGMTLGPALEDVGQLMDAVARSDAARYATGALAQAQQQWTQSLLDRQQSAAPGAPGFTQSLMADYNKYVQQAVKGAPRGPAGAFLQQRLTAFGTDLARQSMEFEARQRLEHNANTFTDSVNAAGSELLLNPQNFGARLAERRELLGQLNLDPGTREKLWNHAQSELARFATLGDIQRDPYAASMELNSADPKNLYTKVLTPELREQLIGEADRMLHQRVADSERLHALTKQQQEDTSNDLLRQGIVAAQGGKLTPQWVTSHASLLEPQALKYLYDEAAGRSVQSDLHTYSDLLTRTLRGDDTTEDAQTALFGGRLSKEDYTRIVDAGATKANWAKQGDDRIKTGLAVSQMNPDPAHSTSLMNARTDWQDWVRAHPNATPEEAEKQSLAIVNRYQIIDGSQSMLTLPVPEHLVGSRTAPDIQASKQALVRAYQAGLAGQPGGISHEEFNKEAALLAQWERAVTLAKANAAKAKPHE